MQATSNVLSDDLGEELVCELVVCGSFFAFILFSSLVVPDCVLCRVTIWKSVMSRAVMSAAYSL